MILVQAILGTLFGLLAAAGVGYLLAAHRATIRHFRDARPDPLPDPAPPVSILKPVEGADAETRLAFESFCRLDYPGEVELLVGTIREDDPIVPVVRRLQADHPDKRIELVFADLLGANRKTSIMRRLVAEASTDLLIFSDADVRVASDYLSWIVPPLVRDEVGTVTFLPRGIDLRTIGAKLIALHYDFVYLPQWMAALATTGIEWAIGHTMAQRREVLNAYGGFDAFLDALADDYELGHRSVQLGKRVEVPPYLLETYMPQESFGAACRRLQRWMRTIRRARPRSFAGVIFCHPLPWTLLLALTFPTSPLAWLGFAAVVVLRLGLAVQMPRIVRLPEFGRCLPLLPLLDLIEWLTFFGAWCGNTIVWAGRRYRLLPDGSLSPLDGASR